MIVVIFTLCLVLLIFLLSRRRFYKLACQIRGPVGFPLVGVGLEIRNGVDMLKFMRKVKQNYGSPAVSWLGPDCILYVSDAETMKTVLTSEYCLDKGNIYRFMEYAVGKGAFTSNCPLWNERQKILKPAFHKQILSSYNGIFNDEGNNLISLLSKSVGKELEMYENLKKFALSVACQTTMGKQIHLQEDQFQDILNTYSTSMEAISNRMFKPWYHLDFLYKLSPTYKEDINNFKKINVFMEELISHKRNFSKEVPDHDQESFTKSKDIFIDHISKYVYEGKISWDDVRDEANVIIAAAFETTSITLFITFLCLAVFQEVQENLYNELCDLFPKSTDVEKIHEDTLKEMKYVEMVINESMRYMAPVPVVGRVAMKDLTLKSGVVVPKGTQIILDIFNLHRDVKYWGENAEMFNPENFSPTAANVPPYAFVPFTKGLRMCIGYQYAMNLMKMAIAKIFRNFRITTDVTFKNIVLKGNISMKFERYPEFKVLRR